MGKYEISLREKVKIVYGSSENKSKFQEFIAKCKERENNIVQKKSCDSMVEDEQIEVIGGNDSLVDFDITEVNQQNTVLQSMENE